MLLTCVRNFMELLGLRIYRINSASGDDKLMQPNIISPPIKLALGHTAFIIVPVRHTLAGAFFVVRLYQPFT